VTADPPLNPTAASLLGFLHAGEASGYELVGIAELVIGNFWTLTRSQVYRELATLSGRGLVDEGEVGPRSRRPYRLTDAGRAAFADWVTRPPGAEQIRYPLLLTTAFGEFLGADRLLAMVAEHRPVHEKRLADYRDQLADPAMATDPYRRATLAFGQRYEQMVLAWMDELPALLTGGAGTDER
jgi:DNA-binding PadR family transcriptional regulator